jgi:hypothetical protein
MRRLIAPVLIVLAACAGQDTVDPCTVRINVIDTPNMFVGNTRVVEADVTVRAGFCGAAETEVAWNVVRTEVAEITASSDSSATIRAKRAGQTYLIARLARTPSVRDSTFLNVIAATDTTASIIVLPRRAGRP